MGPIFAGGVGAVTEALIITGGLLGLLWPQVFLGGFAMFAVVWLQDQGRLTRRWSNILTTTGLMVAPTAFWIAVKICIAVIGAKVIGNIVFFQAFLILGSLLVGPILGFFLHRRWLKAQG